MIDLKKLSREIANFLITEGSKQYREIDFQKLCSKVEELMIEPSFIEETAVNITDVIKEKQKIVNKYFKYKNLLKEVNIYKNSRLLINNN